MALKVVITTFQTLANDLNPPPTVASNDVHEWVRENGYVISFYSLAGYPCREVLGLTSLYFIENIQGSIS